MKGAKFGLLWGLVLFCLFAFVLESGCGRRPQAGMEKAAATELATPVFVIQAETGDIEQRESLTGSVEPQQETDVQTEIAGKVAWVGVDVGDRVTRGQALVRLDTALAAAGAQQSSAAAQAARARYEQAQVALKLTREQTASQIAQAEKNLEQARNRLRQAKINAELTRKRVEDVITQAQIGVRQAETQLADVRAGARKQEIAQAQARVEQAKAAVRLAKLNLERLQNLLKSGAVAQAQVDAAQVEYETALGNQRVAEQALDLAQEGARTEQVRLAELQVNQARQALAQAENQREQIEIAQREVQAAEVAVAQAEEALRLARAQQSQVAATEKEVRAAKAAAQQAEAAVRLSTTQVRKHIVYAPISGVVAIRFVDPGEGAMPGLPLIRIVNLHPARINCEATELQVARMRVGMEAEISVDALGGRRFRGKITDIAPQSVKDKRIYIVRVEVPNPQGVLKAGMFARVSIVTGIHRGAVLVPREALVERDEERLVYAVQPDNRIQVRRVEIGASTNGLVEIVKGVRPGETLVFGGQSMLAEGERVKPTPRHAKASLAAP